jgi:hypothetical protein
METQELIQILKDNGLMVVARQDYRNMVTARINEVQATVLRKKAATIGEIAKSELWPVKTRQSIKRWIDEQIINEKEWYTAPNGKIMITNSCIRRLSEF